jgi:hypothetical protein
LYPFFAKLKLLMHNSSAAIGLMAPLYHTGAGRPKLVILSAFTLRGWDEDLDAKPKPQRVFVLCHSAALLRVFWVLASMV